MQIYNFQWEKVKHLINAHRNNVLSGPLDFISLSNSVICTSVSKVVRYSDMLFDERAKHMNDESWKDRFKTFADNVAVLQVNNRRGN